MVFFAIHGILYGTMNSTILHSDEAYQNAFRRLNARQKEAVTTIEGPVMVLAGPGTGKTQILALRIAHILMTTDATPEEILALTFTDAGVAAMRERLRTYVGPLAYRIAIHTFHSFSERLIRSYPDSYARVIGGRRIDDIEKIRMVEDILSSNSFSYIRPIGKPTFYVPHIMRAIGVMKQEYVTPDGLRTIIAEQETQLAKTDRLHEKGAHKGKVRSEYQKLEKHIAKNKELLQVYVAYMSLLKKQGLYDYDDMIIETVAALSSDESMLRDLQEQYQYIHADEHQDGNGSQNKILELLASYHASPNIFVVGDEKQAIYRFQGASLENFLNFEDVFVGTKVVSLTDNYRSGQQILDAAYSLMKTDDEFLAKLRTPLTAVGVEAATVARASFEHQGIEDVWVGDAIESLLEEGTAATEIAVIVRTNREVDQIATHLRKREIAVSASAESDILGHPLLEQIRQLIRAVIEMRSEEGLFAVLQAPYWDISRTDVVRILSHRSHTQTLQESIGDASYLTSCGVSDIKNVLRVHALLEEARQRQVSEAPHRVLEHLLVESGFLTYVMDHDPHEGGRVIRRLYDEIERLVTENGASDLQAVLTTIDTHIAYMVPLNAPYVVTTQDAVQVMTAHKSKGLEFSHVFIPHLTDRSWGATRHARVLFVADYKTI